MELVGAAGALGYPYHRFRRIQSVGGGIADFIGQLAVDPRPAEQQRRAAPLLLKHRNFPAVLEDEPLGAAGFLVINRRIALIGHLNVGDGVVIHLEQPGLIRLRRGSVAEKLDPQNSPAEKQQDCQEQKG